MSESKSTEWLTDMLDALDALYDPESWLDALSTAVGLTKRETQILLRMSRYADPATGKGIDVSTGDLAAATGISRTNIIGSRGAIASLVRKGWLIRTREHASGRPAEYRLSYGEFRVIVPED